MLKNQALAPKYNSDKPRVELIPTDPMEKIAEAYSIGIAKYEINSWRKGFPFTDLIGAAKRHLHDLQEGRDLDEDSGCLAAAQVIWNMLSLLQQMLDGRFDLDNRYVQEKDEIRHITSFSDFENQLNYFKERYAHYASLQTQSSTEKE